MNQLGFPLLTITIFLPFFGALVTLLLGNRRNAIKVWGLLISLATLVLTSTLWFLFDYGQSSLQFVDRLVWIEAMGINYHVGIDGISLWMLLLTAYLSPLAVLLAWMFLDKHPDQDARRFMFFLLATETGTLGVFASVDMILFYLFWEAVLVPVYFLIGRWGGPNRIGATLKFFLYTMAGSALMLIGILVLAVLHYQNTGVLTFSWPSILAMPLPRTTQLWLLLAFALAFAVKAPVWPLHSWLPDAYVESPTPVAVLLAGILSKMGIYGLIRFCIPAFPNALDLVRPWLWLLAITGIVYGSLMALVQRDMKRLVAFSSLAHMGMIVAGVVAGNAQGIQGALIQSLSHGLTVGALFALVSFLESRRGTRQIDDYGGLWKSMPHFGSLALTVLLAAIGLPGLSGFPGEFTMLLGIFRVSTAAAAFATLGIVLGAWYMLNLFRTAFAGPLQRAENRSLPDLRRREAIVLLPMVIMMFVIGIIPNLIVQPTETSVQTLLNQADAQRIVLVE